MFARAHNRRKDWISLGNQLPGVYLVEPDLIERFNASYPDAKLTKEVMDKNKESSIVKKTI
jgi:mRNA (2'-O-methyladenosine-N6-)-methyltransferase